MAAEGACRGEFAQLVSNHIFRYINRNVFASVMHGDGMSDELREMVLDLDQVFTTFLVPLAFISSMRFISAPST